MQQAEVGGTQKPSMPAREQLLLRALGLLSLCVAMLADRMTAAAPLAVPMGRDAPLLASHVLVSVNPHLVGTVLKGANASHLSVWSSNELITVFRQAKMAVAFKGL